MKKKYIQYCKSRSGFSLVEILVVMVIMGLAVTAIMGLYVNMQRSSSSSEEVVELQQGLRIALARIAFDLHMAGFLVTGNAVSTANANQITLRTATTNNTAARIEKVLEPGPAEEDKKLPAGTTTAVFEILPAEMALMFDKDDMLRVVDPASGCLVFASSCTDKKSPVLTVSTQPVSGKITVKFDGLPAEVRVQRENILVRVSGVKDADGDYPYPNTITYALDPDPEKPGTQRLTRRLNGELPTTNNALVGKMSMANGLTFVYNMDDGSTLTDVPAARLGEIRSVQVALEATTIDSQALSGGSKVRAAGTIVKLRNR